MSSTKTPGQLLVFDPRDPATDSVKAYKVRKTHKKSRGGCAECKARRVKCDETRPACGPCTRRSMECSYKASSINNNSNHAIRQETSEMVLARSEVRITSFTPTSVQQYYNSKFLRKWPPIWPGKASPHVLADDPSAFTSQYDLPILHHLSEGTIGPSLFAENTPNFHIDVISIGLSNAHVMHALLAASALHIRFTQHPTLISSTSIQPAPSTLLSCLTVQRSIDPFASIEAGHHLSASHQFRQALEAFSNRTITNVDPLLTTCMLLNMLSFAGLPESGPPTSRWPFTTNPNTTTTDPSDASSTSSSSSSRPLNWLRIQLGFAPLLENLTQHMRATSQWLAFFMTLGHEAFYDDRPGTTDIPPRFREFFDVTPASTVDNHPNLRLVRRLLSVLSVHDATERAGGGGDRHDAQVLRYFQFMQGVDEAWVGRLEGRDVRCLVLYGWFMAVLCKVRHWWARVRAVRECGAVVAWLDAWCRGEVVGGAEASSLVAAVVVDGEAEKTRVREWLPFMARAVGYRLRCFEDDELDNAQMMGIGLGGSYVDVGYGDEQALACAAILNN